MKLVFRKLAEIKTDRKLYLKVLCANIFFQTPNCSSLVCHCYDVSQIIAQKPLKLVKTNVLNGQKTYFVSTTDISAPFKKIKLRTLLAGSSNNRPHPIPEIYETPLDNAVLCKLLHSNSDILHLEYLPKKIPVPLYHQRNHIPQWQYLPPHAKQAIPLNVTQSGNSFASTKLSLNAAQANQNNVKKSIFTSTASRDFKSERQESIQQKKRNTDSFEDVCYCCKLAQNIAEDNKFRDCTNLGHCNDRNCKNSRELQFETAKAENSIVQRHVQPTESFNEGYGFNSKSLKLPIVDHTINSTRSIRERNANNIDNIWKVCSEDVRNLQVTDQNQSPRTFSTKSPEQLLYSEVVVHGRNSRPKFTKFKPEELAFIQEQRLNSACSSFLTRAEMLESLETKKKSYTTSKSEAFPVELANNVKLNSVDLSAPINNNQKENIPVNYTAVNKRILSSRRPDIYRIPFHPPLQYNRQLALAPISKPETAQQSSARPNDTKTTGNEKSENSSNNNNNKQSATQQSSNQKTTTKLIFGPQDLLDAIERQPPEIKAVAQQLGRIALGRSTKLYECKLERENEIKAKQRAEERKKAKETQSNNESKKRQSPPPTRKSSGESNETKDMIKPGPHYFHKPKPSGEDIHLNPLEYAMSKCEIKSTATPNVYRATNKVPEVALNRFDLRDGDSEHFYHDFRENDSRPTKEYNQVFIVDEGLGQYVPEKNVKLNRETFETVANIWSPQNVFKLDLSQAQKPIQEHFIQDVNKYAMFSNDPEVTTLVTAQKYAGTVGNNLAQYNSTKLSRVQCSSHALVLNTARVGAMQELRDPNDESPERAELFKLPAERPDKKKRTKKV